MLSIGLEIAVASLTDVRSLGAPVSAPSGFTDFSRPTIFRASGNIFTTNYNHDAVKPAFTQTVYVGAVADNAGDGLSYANRKRSIKAAIGAANAFTGQTVRILVDGAPKLYRSSVSVSGMQDGWAGFAPTVDLVIESNDGSPIISIADVAMPAYTLDSGAIYKSTYTVEAPSTTLFDMANLDVDGHPIALYPVLSVANVLAPQTEINDAATTFGRGAVFLDAVNKVLWARTFNDRAPNADMIVSSAGGNGILSNAASRSLWMDKVRFFGGNVAFKATGVGSTVNHTIRTRDCFFGCAHGNGFEHVTGGAAVITHQRPRAKYCKSDGLNYKGANTSQATCPTVVEIDAIADWNGWDNAGINNGTTAHEYTRAVRVNGRYRNNADRNAHDIQASENWYLGCVAGPGRTAGNNVGVRAGNGDGAAEVTKTWIDGGSIDLGCEQELFCGLFSQIRHANLDTTGFTLGGTPANIQVYTP